MKLGPVVRLELEVARSILSLALMGAADQNRLATELERCAALFPGDERIAASAQRERSLHREAHDAIRAFDKRISEAESRAREAGS